ncbi:hypothetical protein ACFSR9_05865 [Deinococcus taklimakanensis]|uniref:Uncharacterized protein n=1 Tax=Deinococcus taklimakanensis TaxID=536443 RepID=A0ABW5P135_9DEIO
MDDSDRRAARSFRTWLARQGVGLDALVEHAPGTSRATLSALMGTNGDNGQTGWNRARRTTLVKVLTAVNDATGLSLSMRQLGEIVGADLERGVWHEE